MKKGFTLIELLAVIVIIGVVALIAVPVVNRNIKESREKLYDIQVQDIELAAKKWATDNYSELDSEYLNATMVEIEMLKKLEYLPNELIKNPINGEVMSGCVEIAYDIENKSYNYSYVVNSDNCKYGYYYEYNEDSDTWIKNTTNQKISISSYLIGENNANVVASGSGLYEEDDCYIFRGNNIQNNYVKIGGESTLFRIISIDKLTKSMKVVKTSGIPTNWDSDGNTNFVSSDLHTEKLVSNDSYNSLINSNMKWNVGSIDVDTKLNVDAIKAYESKTQINMNVCIISMSEYMEASLNSDCLAGNLTSCAQDNYLSDISDAWTLTTTFDSVAYINSEGELKLETKTSDDNTNPLKHNHHNVYETFYLKTVAKNGEGTRDNPFIISAK